MTYPAPAPVAASVSASAAQPASTWLDVKNPYYRERIAQWVYTRDHYTGRCADPERVATYLIRKKIGETQEAFDERVLLADYTPHFSAVVDTLAGMLCQIEDDASRVWGKTKKGRPSKKVGPLGDPTDPSTRIGMLWADADGSNTGWLTQWQLLATDLVAMHDGWVFVDGGVDGKNPHVRLYEAEAVHNWRDPSGVIVEALICEKIDERTSLQDTKDPDAAASTRYLHLTVGGWQRYEIEKDEANKPIVTALTGPGDVGAWKYQTRSGQPTIPLYRAQLPLRRNVGFMMARKANAIFNKESERDHLLRFGCFPILNVYANDTAFKKIVADLRAGSRVLQVTHGQQAHSFAAPDSGPAAILNTTINDKIDEFYTTAFREFGTSARAGRDRVTAAEIKSDTAAGIAAFLSLLRGALDNAENAALYLLEQTVFPKDPANWGLAHVERSHDYAPFDINGAIERLRTRYFGAAGVVPIGPTGLANVVKEIAAWDGVEVDDAEIDEAVKTPEPVKPAAPGLSGTGGGMGAQPIIAGPVVP